MKRRVVLAALAAALGLHVPQADASMSGPCSATINGIDVAPLSASDPGDAIELKESDTALVSARSASPVGDYRVQLEFAGIRWTVHKGTTNDTNWQKSVKVEDYSRYGAGLYRVHGTSSGCDGAALIKVDGNPLTTPLGLAGAAFVGIGLVNAALNLRRRQGATS